MGAHIVPAGPFQLPSVDTFTVTTEAGDAFYVAVGVPHSYAHTEDSYPVAVVLDGDLWFTTWLESSRARGASGEMEELVVVGVGYPPGSAPATIGARRTYDFSTEAWDLTTPVGRQAQAVFDELGEPLRLGGADAFLDLLTADIKPMIIDRYRVDAERFALFGHSAGANLAAHMLFRRTDAFSSYIMASPGFCYNDWQVLKLEEEYGATHVDLPATVCLGAGSDETLLLSVGGLVSGTAAMAERLHQRGYPSLRLSCDVFHGKGHYTACTAMIERAQDICWPGTPWSFGSAP